MLAGGAIHSAEGLGGVSSLAGAGATCTQDNTFKQSIESGKGANPIEIVHAPRFG